MVNIMNKTNLVKKIAASLMLAMAVTTTVPVFKADAAGNERKIVRSDMPVKVLYNARQVASDVKPKVVDGAVLVPIRFIAEKIGSTITVANNNKDIKIKKGSNVVDVSIGSKTATINGKAVTLNATVVAENGRTLVPIQVVGGLGVPVEWDGLLKFVWVGHKEVPELKDVLPAGQDIKPFLKFFKGHENLLNHTTIDQGVIKKDTVYIIDDSIFPVKTRSSTYYRYDLAWDNNGEQYIQATSGDKGLLSTGMAFITDKQMLDRGAATVLRANLTPQVRYNYHQIIARTDFSRYDIKNYKDFKFNTVNYIMLGYGYPGVILLKNNWR